MRTYRGDIFEWHEMLFYQRIRAGILCCSWIGVIRTVVSKDSHVETAGEARICNFTWQSADPWYNMNRKTNGKT